MLMMFWQILLDMCFFYYYLHYYKEKKEKIALGYL